MKFSGENMKTSDFIQNKRKEILQISSSHGAKNIRIFGSVARGDDEPESDIDILIELDKGRTLLDLAGLSIDLQNLLGRKVDVVTEKSLHWYIREKIISEAKPI